MRFTVLRCWAVVCLWATAGAAAPMDLITCGWDQVRAYRVEGTNASVLWSWSARNGNLPQWTWPLFATTDECKPQRDGTILVTSSGGDSLEGAVALVDPKTSNALFFARAPNAHSADLLPLGRVAVALSYRTNGNRLAVFNLSQSDQELFSVPLFGAHGVVWDQKRQVLWGMADTYIREYELQDWNTSTPQLRQTVSTPLPEVGGHDMYPIPNSPLMTIAAGYHCYLFNRDTRQFVKHPLIGDVPGVKGICAHPASGQVVYVKAEISWWSERLRFADPDNLIFIPGEHFYKARWLAPEFMPISIRHQASGTMEIFWPSLWSGYVLEQSPLAKAQTWSSAMGDILVSGTNRVFVVTNQSSKGFFRLRRAD